MPVQCPQSSVNAIGLPALEPDIEAVTLRARGLKMGLQGTRFEVRQYDPLAAFHDHDHHQIVLPIRGMPRIGNTI